jgi:putative ABC transport system substrate-binding protein
MFWRALAADPSLFSYDQRIAELAVQHHLPSICWLPASVRAGCLMSYGASARDRPQRIATYVDKILRGANPADLPVEQPMQFDLVVNLKTATALGIPVPPLLLFQATEVIR